MNSSFLFGKNESLCSDYDSDYDTSGNDELERELEANDSFLHIYQDVDEALNFSISSLAGFTENSEDISVSALSDYDNSEFIEHSRHTLTLHSTPVKRQIERSEVTLDSDLPCSSKSLSVLQTPSTSIIHGEHSSEDSESDLSFLVIPEQQSVIDDVCTLSAKKRKVQSSCDNADSLTDSKLLVSNNCSVSSWVSSGCCSNHCLTDVDLKPLTSFASKSIIEQNQFLMDSFNLLSNQANEIQHMIAGKQVCKRGFILYFKISNKRYNRIFEQFIRNSTLKVQRKPVIRSQSAKVTEAKAWMARYFKRIGDSMPHLEQTHLPHGLTKQDVYMIMKRELLHQGIMSTISLSHFYAIWDTSFKNVRIPKVHISKYSYSYYI